VLTCRGNRLSGSRRDCHHPFENLRRKGRKPARAMAAVRGAVYRVPFTLDSRRRLCLYQPRRQGRKRGNGTGAEMSRVTPQRRGAADETAVRLTARRRYAGVRGALATARQGGVSVHGYCKPAPRVRDGSPQGGDSLAGSVHDSPPGRPADTRHSVQEEECYPYPPHQKTSP
jgi:hypothetical protein